MKLNVGNQGWVAMMLTLAVQMTVRERAPQLSITDLKVKWLLCFTFSFVQPILQHYKNSRRSVSAENMDDSPFTNVGKPLHYRELLLLLSLLCKM